MSDAVTQGTLQEITKPKPFTIYTLGIIPAGTTDFSLYLIDDGRNDTIQIFTRSGQHLAGTTLTGWIDKPPYDTGTAVNPTSFITETNGFLPNAVYDATLLNGIGGNIPVDHINMVQTPFTVNGMKMTYSGDNGDQHWPAPSFDQELLTIDNVTEDLIILIPGYDTCRINPDWTYMPTTGPPQTSKSARSSQPSRPNAHTRPHSAPRRDHFHQNTG